MEAAEDEEQAGGIRKDVGEGFGGGSCQANDEPSRLSPVIGVMLPLPDFIPYPVLLFHCPYQGLLRPY